MRFRTIFPMLLFVAGAFVLPHIAHASIPFFGPIVPDAINKCAAGWGMIIVVINHIIEFLLTLLIVFVAPVMIAYAGFLFVVNPVNPSEKQKAKSVLTNTILGIAIALSAWLIVDAVMAALYNPSAQGFGQNWASIINWSGDACLPQVGSLYQLNQGLVQGASPTGVISVVPPATNCAASYASTLPGITVSSSGNCCDRTNSTCTSLDGMMQSTVQQILNIQQACGGVVVTGGTEVGHASEGGAGSHSSGAKVDIGANLLSCVLHHGGTTVSQPSFGSAQVKGSCGDIYTWEGNHTDIYVVSNCTL